MIRVPLQQNDSFVEIKQDQMPQDGDKLSKMLAHEKAPIEYWLEIAVSCKLLTNQMDLVDVLQRW